MPKAFRFRLEPLLGLRRLREDVARRDAAAARRAVGDQNRVLLAFLRDEEEGKSALRGLKQKTLDLVRLRLQEGYLNALERRIRKGFEVLQDLVRKELEKRRSLAEAVKGVRVLERLRERQQREHRYLGDRHEQKFLDEIAQQRARETA